MQSGARAVAIVVLHSMLAALAFAGDANKPATNPPDNGVSEAVAVAANEPLPQASPAPKAKKSASSSDDGSRPGGEIFLGYSYVRFNTQSATLPGGAVVNQQFNFIPGGIAQANANVNRWFGLTADFAGYGVHNVTSINAKFYTYLFGPRFILVRTHRWTVFADALGGGARVSATLNGPPNTIFFNRSFHDNAAAAAGGGGVDFTFRKHVAFRIAEAEYLFTTFGDNNHNRQNNLRLSTGIVFRFGFPSAPPPPPVHHPPTANCSANPTTVHQEMNEVSVVRADATSPDGSPLTYAWSATGGTVDGTGPEVRWNPGSSTPGSYTVTAKVTDATGAAASCSADVHVEPRPNRPPTMTCSASPASVPAGDKTTITANASDPDNDPLTYTWAASGGTVSGSGASVQLDTTGVKPGPYTVTGKVSDGRGGTADCTANITVTKPAEQIQLEMRLALHSIYFPTAQPTVAKPNGGLVPSQESTLTTLANDFKRYLTFRPDAHLTLRGHTDPRGSVKYNQALSERRVGSTKNFLTEHGVPADAIQTEGLGEEHQLSEAEVKQMVEQDNTITGEQRARILKNLRVVTLAQNRRVDVVLSTTGETSVRVYPFNSADVLNLISPRAPATGKAPAKKTAPAKKPAPKKQ
jgi:outer membrane protein OmpA-like peptidoglycan-associated protein